MNVLKVTDVTLVGGKISSDAFPISVRTDDRTDVLALAVVKMNEEVRELRVLIDVRSVNNVMSKVEVFQAFGRRWYEMIFHKGK